MRNLFCGSKTEGALSATLCVFLEGAAIGTMSVFIDEKFSAASEAEGRVETCFETRM